MVASLTAMTLRRPPRLRRMARLRRWLPGQAVHRCRRGRARSRGGLMRRRGPAGGRAERHHRVHHQRHDRDRRQGGHPDNQPCPRGPQDSAQPVAAERGKAGGKPRIIVGEPALHLLQDALLVHGKRHGTTSGHLGHRHHPSRRLAVAAPLYSCPDERLFTHSLPEVAAIFRGRPAAILQLGAHASIRPVYRTPV
jgi:hypothetical protein